MNDESEIGLVETHAKRGRGNQRFHPVLQQRILQFNAALPRFPGVGFHIHAPGPKPSGHLPRVAHGQRIDYPVS